MKIHFLFFVTLSIFFTHSPNTFSQNNVFGKFEEYEKSGTAKKASRKLEANDVAGALKILDKAIEQKEDLFEAYRKRSFIRRYYNDDIDGAISDLNKAMEIKPDDVNLYISRAFLKKRYKNDLNSALLDYQIAQKYKPDSTILFSLIADLKSELKDFDGAIVEIKSALKIIPEDIDFHVKLSNLLLQKNQPDKAIVFLQGFLDDYVKKANGKLPKVRGERVKKKIPSEFKDSSNVKNPIPVKRYSQMDFNVNSAKDYEKQLAEIERARSLSKAFIELGKMFISKNELDKAFENLNTALEIDKNHEEAYGLRGIIYLSKGEFEKAIAEFSDAIDIADVPYFYLNRGIAYLAIANDKKSQADFGDFLKLYPEGRAILEQRIAEIKQSKENLNKPK
jgi:tetratricopeptide (TPR) repeat protein